MSDSQTPAYVSYGFFVKYLGRLREHGVPDRISAGHLREQGMGAAHSSQLRGALRWLGLTAPDGTPTNVLRALVDADRNGVRLGLRLAIESSYRDVFGEFSLADLAKDEIYGAFSNLDVSESTQRKCGNFIENAQAHLTGDGDTATDSRLSRTSEIHSASSGGDSEQRVAEDSATESSALPQLPPYDEKWSDDMKRHWFQLFEKLLDKQNGTRR